MLDTTRCVPKQGLELDTTKATKSVYFFLPKNRSAHVEGETPSIAKQINFTLRLTHFPHSTIDGDECQLPNVLSLRRLGK